jgi:hypothetical protein
MIMIPVDTNPADFGKYDAAGGAGPDGVGLIGGPLLTDTEAAALVVSTQESTVETGPNGAANEADNSYFEAVAVPNPNPYVAAVQAVWAAYPVNASAPDESYGGAALRIDGACPMSNPTTAEVLQWAANKWGINPILLYAEATQEGNWDQTTEGDCGESTCDAADGLSSGVLQVGDRNTTARPYHAFPGLSSGLGDELDRENTCYNADYYAAYEWATFNGLTGFAPAGDIGAAIQSWYQGNTTGAGTYTTSVYDHITSGDWIDLYFDGVAPPL